MAENSGKKLRYLIIGATGLVGRNITKVLSERNERWEGFYHRRPEEGLTELDITSEQLVREAIIARMPETVFHCANLAGGVNYCESHPGIAKKFHLQGTHNLCAACAMVGARLVFISSDYVFPDLTGPATEEDKPAPLNIYGQLKWEAEQLIQKTAIPYMIIRTTNVYGWDLLSMTPNYVMSLYNTIKEQKRFAAPSFLWGNPTYAGDLAEKMLILSDKGADGIYHVVGNDYINRYQWALKACEVLNLDKSLIDEVKTPPPDIVKRPMKLTLNTDKATRTTGKRMISLREGLEIMHKEAIG